MYDTISKADAGRAIGPVTFSRLARACKLPAVAIGGLDAANAAGVMIAGAAGVAVIRAVLGSDDPEASARALRAAIGEQQ